MDHQLRLVLKKRIILIFKKKITLIYNQINQGYKVINELSFPQQSYNQAPVQQQQPASYSNGTSSDFEEMPLDDDLPF